MIILSPEKISLKSHYQFKFLLHKPLINNSIKTRTHQFHETHTVPATHVTQHNIFVYVRKEIKSVSLPMRFATEPTLYRVPWTDSMASVTSWAKSVWTTEKVKHSLNMNM